MKELILQITKAKHKASGGSCGTYLMDVAKQLDIPITELEQVVIEMCDVIDVRPGIHGLMLMHLKRK